MTNALRHWSSHVQSTGERLLRVMAIVLTSSALSAGGTFFIFSLLLCKVYRRDLEKGGHWNPVFFDSGKKKKKEKDYRVLCTSQTSVFPEFIGMLEERFALEAPMSNGMPTGRRMALTPWALCPCAAGQPPPHPLLGVGGGVLLLPTLESLIGLLCLLNSVSLAFPEAPVFHSVHSY